MIAHANRGIAWQRCLEGWNDVYRRERRATVFPTEAKIRRESRVTPDGRFRARFVGDGPPDFIGRAGGRPVCFDAKDCDGDRWSLSKLELHQAKDLESWSLDPNAIAFVALRIHGVGWVIPWSTLGPVWWGWHEREGRAASGTASLTVGRIAELGIRMPVLGDWLGALP